MPPQSLSGDQLCARSSFFLVHGGMTEIEISRLAQKLMLDGGAHYPGFVIITSGTGNYGRISKTASNRTLEEGDFLWLDLGARYNNYWSDFCRAGVVGKREPHLADLQKKSEFSSHLRYSSICFFSLTISITTICRILFYVLILRISF